MISRALVSLLDSFRIFTGDGDLYTAPEAILASHTSIVATASGQPVIFSQEVKTGRGRRVGPAPSSEE